MTTHYERCNAYEVLEYIKTNPSSTFNIVTITKLMIQHLTDIEKDTLRKVKVKSWNVK